MKEATAAYVFSEKHYNQKSFETSDAMEMSNCLTGKLVTIYVAVFSILTYDSITIFTVASVMEVATECFVSIPFQAENFEILMHVAR